MNRTMKLKYRGPLYPVQPGEKADDGDWITCPECNGEGCPYCNDKGFVELDRKIEL